MRNNGHQRTRLLVARLIRCLYLLVAFAILFPAPFVPSQALAQTTAIDPVEMEFWKSVSTSKDAAEMEAYLAAFPNGKFVAIARIRLKKLQAKANGPDPKAAVKASSAPIPPPVPAVPPAPTTAKAPPSIQKCDRLAANPNDPAKVGKGVSYKELPVGEALTACRAALKTYPDEPRFLYQLGRALHKQKRFAEASKAFRTAAEKGEPAAMTAVGMAYSLGRRIEKDDAEAVRWYRKAAEKGDPEAMSEVGVAYSLGRGVEKDDAEAVRWHRKAAEKGNATALLNLGLRYARGRGVVKSDVKAVRLLRKAAEKGNKVASYSLGYMYDRGRGVARDSQAAARYVLDALRKGFKFSLDQMTTNSNAWSKEFRRALQRLMKDAGVYGGAIDGSFGLDTIRAIKALAKLPKAQNTEPVASPGQPITATTPPPPTPPLGGGVNLGNF